MVPGRIRGREYLEVPDTEEVKKLNLDLTQWLTWRKIKKKYKKKNNVPT